MGILYLISVLILLIAFILTKKTEKKIRIISFISISIVTLFCYNTLICYILTFFTIPNTLGILTIINILISLLFIIRIIKNKEIQKFKFEKIEILYIFIIAILTLIVSYINFGIPFNVKYETSDPVVHYLAATTFADSDALLAAEIQRDDVYGTLKNIKPLSYVNSGLLIKCFCENFKVIESYNIFVLFGVFVLFLTGISIYSAMLNIAKKKEHIFYAFIISLICMLGYPLNSFLFGFEYLSMGLLVICVIIDLMNYYNKELLELKWFIPIMALLNLGLFLSYYMFVVFTYPAQWIYLCIKNYSKTKKIITKELVILLLTTLLIPFCLGYIYTIAPDIYAVLINNSTDMDNVMANSSYLLNSGFQNNGYIYINLYSNMLLLLPLPIYLFIKDIKNKNIKNNIFIYLLLIFAMLFIGILLIGNSFGKVSMYYLSKNYFALWIMLLYSNYLALVELSKNGNYLPRLFIGSYVILMIICTMFSDVKMIDDALKNKDENILSVMEVFGANKTMLIKEEPKLNQGEIDILTYAKENLDSTSQIEFVTEGIPYYWSYVLTRYINYEEELDKISNGQTKLNYKAYFVKEKTNKVDYMIYFKRSENYMELKDKLFKNSEIIYENEYGGILKYKK